MAISGYLGIFEFQAK